MEPLMLLMTLVGMSVLWVYFAFQPKYVKKEQLRIFNWVTFGVTLFVAAAFVLNINVVFGDPSYDKYRRAIALCGSLGIVTVMLTFFFLMRNFWVFKSSSGRGTGFFR